MVSQTVLVDTQYEEGHLMATLMYDIECSQVHSIECTIHSYNRMNTRSIACSQAIFSVLTVTSYT